MKVFKRIGRYASDAITILFIVMIAIYGLLFIAVYLCGDIPRCTMHN